ncbi:MAG: LPS export ABC transporter periplasmic protein LptC [Gammaproteobacteria bacterium]|nr:LPS export ABC transporter periplasmic protein LptC [Gammaproteobacteria bacterium]MDH3428730.1 LPS export ABC transporter periplasmic protein LptC [Gammaproteobacteria bacterium]
MISPRNIVIIGALAAGAIASWYLARTNLRDNGDTPAFDAAQRGYYLKSARILGTGSDGALLYELQAEYAEQQDDDHVSFTDVRINYSPQSDVPWSVNADSATIHADQQRVVLHGHVRAVSSEGFSGNDTEIRTQHLEIDPENYLAETDERVQIRIGARSLTATGMLASLKDNRVQLKSNVSGKFAP